MANPPISTPNSAAPPSASSAVAADVKSIFASKTFWFNVLALAVQAGQAVLGMNIIPEPWGAVVQGVVNIGLRYVTTQGVSL